VGERLNVKIEGGTMGEPLVREDKIGTTQSKGGDLLLPGRRGGARPRNGELSTVSSTSSAPGGESLGASSGVPSRNCYIQGESSKGHL